MNPRILHGNGQCNIVILVADVLTFVSMYDLFVIHESMAVMTLFECCHSATPNCAHLLCTFCRRRLECEIKACVCRNMSIL